ncbi:hypothetical protein M3Y98_01053600 [Aphelenchoides besseyi]|nr:hypothetical protein M3Y98_01053600 [Aphelenchoides besseyi]
MPINHAIALMSSIEVPRSFSFVIQGHVTFDNKQRFLRPDLYLKLLEKCQVASESLKDEVLLGAMQTIEKLSVTVTYQNRKELVELIKTIKSMMPNVKILNVDIKVYEHISHPNISNKLTRLIGSVLDFASQLGFSETYVNCTGELEFVDLGTRQLTVAQLWNKVIGTTFKEMKSTTKSTCVMDSNGDIIRNGDYLTAELEASNYKMKTELSVLHDSADDNSEDDFDLNYGNN